ncbi:DNA cytosine methyltransferase [Burkholderia pyrrocinia]|uniref:DNA cytosine methyltransferase n=1 Tax=Burkholderia pyrrocinia TaxID=60550 RepID=UPI001BCF238F|nr:DNA cytosine methyltransferase [Burkholderia pyrrocinia]QVN21750.1 DNA cytosine methyltransferase [Burkholderia pyrrocinia]
MTAYYNEHEPYAAQWLRNLIAAGHIAPGDVDERSIEDVRPDDLRGYEQCHFFAGIGVWSYALRRAGWPDDRPVWTGSCPCQPFSQAGKGAGFDDERHLWPAWHWLIGECRPAIIFGEQVASSAVEPWIDLVHADMEALDIAFGCVPFPSAGVGSPHIRDRMFWLAYAHQHRFQGGAFEAVFGARRRQEGHALGRCGAPLAVRLADADGGNSCAERQQHGREQRLLTQDGSALREADQGARNRTAGDCAAAGPTNGLWRDADWLLCRDGRWRPVEPGTFPLVDGAPSRVGRLRAYGNAINAEAATQFILAARECLE